MVTQCLPNFLFTCSHQCSPKFPGMFNKLFPLLFQIFESCVFHVICNNFFHLIIFRRSLYSIICRWNYFFIFDKFYLSSLCLLICSQYDPHINLWHNVPNAKCFHINVSTHWEHILLMKFLSYVCISIQGQYVLNWH